MNQSAIISGSLMNSKISIFIRFVWRKNIGAKSFLILYYSSWVPFKRIYIFSNDICVHLCFIIFIIVFHIFNPPQFSIIWFLITSYTTVECFLIFIDVNFFYINRLFPYFMREHFVVVLKYFVETKKYLFVFISSHTMCVTWIFFFFFAYFLFCYIYLLTNPSARAGYDTKSIFKRSLTGLNSEFFFS